MQLDLFYGLPQLFGSILYLALLGSDFFGHGHFQKCYLEFCTVWFHFFWPQSFLKGAILYLALLGSDFFGHSHF